MPTNKKRINMVVDEELFKIITMLSKKDKVSMGKKALDLMKLGLEVEEDRIWAQLARERDNDDSKFISHEEFWKQVQDSV